MPGCSASVGHCFDEVSHGSDSLGCTSASMLRKAQHQKDVIHRKLGGKIEAMTAEQAEVVCQDVAVERLTELSAERAATYATGQSAKDGARYRAECDAEWAGNGTDDRASLAAGEGSTDATRSTTHGTDDGADFHGVMERVEFWRVAARALQ